MRRLAVTPCSSLPLLFVWVQVSLQLPYTGFNWSYIGPDGEEHWHRHFPFCAGVYQSPIDIHNDILLYDSTLLPIELVGYNVSLTQQFIISNNGHSVKMNLPPTMYISNLPSRYTAAQLHLHWGSRHKPEGSEHSINGKRFAAEMHIVHYNSDKYPDLSTAMDKADGLAVLAVFMESGTFHESYENIFCQFNSIRYKDQTVQISGFNVRDLLPERLDEYYRYEGSLTTPPCYPSVLWTVFRNPVQLSHTQLISELASNTTNTMFDADSIPRPICKLVQGPGRPLVALETAMYCTDVDDPSPLEMAENYRHPQEFEERKVHVSFRQGVVLSVVLASILAVLVIIAVTCCLVRRSKRSRKNAEENHTIYKAAVAQEEEDSSKV